MKFRKTFGRVLCGALSSATLLSSFAGMPAFADQIDPVIFEYDGYTVTYEVTNAWDNSETVALQITNTGDTTIEDWMLYFDPNGDITNLWNARTDSFESGETYYRNAGYNADIAPGASVTFNYIVENCSEIPDTYTLCQTRESKAEGYTVDLSLIKEWDDGVYAALTLTNETDKPIEAWELTVETNFQIVQNDTTYGAFFTDLGNNQYLLKATNYTYVINPGASVEIGFEALRVPEFTVTPISLTEVVADDSVVYHGEDIIDIGEAYFKEPSWDDIITDPDTGYQYVRNQLLISAFPGTPKAAVEQICGEIGADLVGYLALTADFQIEFSTEKTLDELATIAEYINSYSFVSNVTLNLLDDTGVYATTNDYLYNDGADDDWNEAAPSGDNWGLEAVHALSAWDNESDFTPVKVGIFDGGFGTNSDVRYGAILENQYPNAAYVNHGTHVSGTISAIHNNNRGIAGVSTDARIYGMTGGNYPGSSMGLKIIFARLVANHVKVINVSMGYANEAMIYAASQSEFPTFRTRAQNTINADAEAISDCLKKLLMQGYDFVICAAAGNTDNNVFIVDPTAVYGFREPASGESLAGLDIRSGHVEAKWGYSLTAISDPEVMKHIIVVGALQTSGSGYQKASFSNYGDRVDVMAPGVNILSTIDGNGYAYMSGTSMATPHVTGVVALMYQVNPSLNGEDVKQILVDSADPAFSLEGINYVIPNAASACDAARTAASTPINDVTFPSGVICGYTKLDTGATLGHVKFSALRKSNGDYNVGIYGIGQHNYMFESDDDGYYMQTLPQGTYDILVSKDGYLPFMIRDIVINPDETTYMEAVFMSDWEEFLDPNASFAVRGKVINAINGQVISGATVKLRKGWNNKNGNYVQNIFGIPRSATTDANGEFQIAVARGTYTAEIVKDGFVTGYFNLISYTDDQFATIIGEMPTMPLTPVLDNGEYRIVLTWGDEPADLDSHLTYYENDNQLMHVYYRQKVGYVNGEQIANLDLDDVTSYGPETITMTLNTNNMQADSVFKYSVHNFSDRSSTDSDRLSLSNATVRVYHGSDLQIYHVPVDRTGNVWHVFDINANGVLTLKNEFYNALETDVQ